MGQAAPAAKDGPDLEPAGLVGVVRDPSGAALRSGSVFLIPASDVGALSQQQLDLTLSPSAAEALGDDEPLEDSLDAHADSYPRAALSGDGSYVFASIPDGSYFVTFRPDASDAYHLPGGSSCRTAVSSESLRGTRLDLTVSGRPSDKARYIGSTACFNCHGRQRSERSAHRVGLQVPGVRGAYQDISPWGAAFDAALRAFDAGKTLYFYACDAARSGDAKCSVSDVDPSQASPAMTPSFELRFARDPSVALGQVGAYTATFMNHSDSSSATYPLALTYGGALQRQQYVTRLQNADGSYTYLVLPVQYNAQGSLANTDPADWPYRDYQSDQWYDFANARLKRPDSAHDFDNQCAGCHLTGMHLNGSASTAYSARAVSDPNGDFDYDGDGRAEEINTGCEACHGPGSEHVEASVRGLRIVSPSLVTPERELLICGRCHGRPLGQGGGGAGAPLSAAGDMPVAGLRRSEYVHGYTTRVDAAASDLFASGDSRSDHQQYTDFIRSRMARNASVLMTCSNCHDAHGDDDHPHMLRSAADDNAACTTCHSDALYTTVRNHLLKATTFNHDAVDDSLLVCTACHMVRTVAAGARHPELLDNLPRDATPVQYMHGDIASHRFTVTPRSQASLQPVAATLGCAFCHGTLFDNP